MKRIGSGWMGTNSIVTSTANQELIPPSPSDWVNVKLGFYKFEFRNLQSCTVKINGGSEIYFDENQGFISDAMDQKVFSFVVVEPGIQFQWIGAY